MNALKRLWFLCLILAVASTAHAQIRQEAVRQQTTYTEAAKQIECEEICSRNQTFPAMYFRSRTLRTTPNGCLAQAERAVRDEGLQNRSQDDGLGSGGTLGTARAYITCVSLPKAGPCGGDGVNVLMIASSSKSAEEANSLLDRLDARFGNPTLIDCGTALNPVDD